MKVNCQSCGIEFTTVAGREVCSYCSGIKRDLKQLRVYFKNYYPMEETIMMIGLRICDEVEKLQEELRLLEIGESYDKKEHEREVEGFKFAISELAKKHSKARMTLNDIASGDYGVFECERMAQKTLKEIR
jgi:hypothetical protein